MSPPQDEQQPVAKFQTGMLVKFTQETGCNLLGDYAQVISTRYVSGEDWSGFVYQLTNEHLSEPIEIGELWLEPYSNVRAVASSPFNNL